MQDNRIIPYEGLPGGDMTAEQRRRLMRLVECYVSPMPDGPEKGALLAQVEGLRAQAGLWSKITLALMTIALLTMSVGHYVG